MSKLIIQHGDRRTEHELGESALVIGRDPECELFFADKKLSRRHARFEPDAPGFSLVDLDSRNGSWVNEERIQKRRLSSGDEIRLGGLTIQFEHAHEDEVEAARTGDEPTVYLTDTPGATGADDSKTVVLGSGGPSATASAMSAADGLGGAESSSASAADRADDSSTRMLSAEDIEDAKARAKDDPSTRMIPVAELDLDSSAEPGPSDDSATRMAPASAVDDVDETLKKVADGPSAGADRTMLAPGEAGRRKVDTGTVLFRDEVEPQLELEREPLPGEAMVDPGAGVSVPSLHAVAERSWTVSFSLIASSLVLFALVVLVLPLASTAARALEQESSTKGRLLMELLAAVNESALGEGRREAASVVAVENTPGVSGAFVLDTASRIVAPASRAGETFAIEGLGVPAGSVRSIRSGSTLQGELVVAGPVTYRGRRVGVAVVTYQNPGSRALTVLPIGCALLAMGLLAAILLGRRTTLVPLQDLRMDIEALAELEGDSLVEHRAYREVSEIARAVNRLVASSSRTPSSD